MDAGTLELVELEDLYLEHIGCKQGHAWCGPCSIVVTCRISDCACPEGAFGCGVAEDYVRNALAMPDAKCLCGFPVSGHWRVISV